MSIILSVTSLAHVAHAGLITTTAVTASSELHAGYKAENLVNGSGLTGATHDDSFLNMWLAHPGDTTPTLTFDLGSLYSITSTNIWQYIWPNNTDRGVNDLDIFWSTDNTTYTLWNSVNLAEGINTAQVFNTAVDAQFIKFDINSSHGSPYIGLSEVQFNGTQAGQTPPTTDVPEPSTLAIFALGMIGLVSRRLKN